MGGLRSSITHDPAAAAAAPVLQASMPMVVFGVGVLFATEKFTVRAALNMVIVGTGIAIASYGG